MNARETAPNMANPSWYNANPSDAVVGLCTEISKI